MPYASVNEVPSYVPKAKRKQWLEVWNSSYKEHGDEERAFREANGVAGPNSSKKVLTKTELYQDTGQYDEQQEAHLRAELVTWANYAENGPTFDPEGDYLCNTCDMRLGNNECNRVVDPIKFKSGGCRIYTKGDVRENQVKMPEKLTQIEAAYTERPTLKGFGCKRCQFAAEAVKPDAIGRPSWCSFWGLHVIPNACCFKNTSSDDIFAPIRGDEDKSEKVEENHMEPIVGKSGRTFDEPLLFCRLAKVDQAKREVWGVVTCEEPDRDDEICDFDTTVPFYQALVDEMQKASSVNPEGGTNIFPLRAMHGLVAAGKGIAIEFRKEAKEIYMGFKVVDDAEWKKVQENVYTGFSQGGRYVKRWKDGDFVRYTAKPGEVSLVDVPCLQAAHFDAVKALKAGGYQFIKDDGSVEIRKYASVEKGAPEIPVSAGVIPSSPTKVTPVDTSNAVCNCLCANCKAGSCSTCTAGEKCACAGKALKAVKYLVESNGEKHLPYTDEDGKPNHRLMGAAWAALHGGYRGNKYEGPNKEEAKKKLKQIYAREGMDTPSEKMERITDLVKSSLEFRINCRAFGKLGKGMYSVARFSSIVEDLSLLWFCLDNERRIEEDDSPATDDVKDALESLLDSFLLYAEEEVEEVKEQLNSKEFVY